MNTHTNRKVVCIKDIPSNLIEEAFFILKTEDIEANCKNAKTIRHEIILKETEDLVKEYTDEFSKMKYEEEIAKNKKQDIKMKIILGTIFFALVCYLFSIIIVR